MGSHPSTVDQRHRRWHARRRSRLWFAEKDRRERGTNVHVALPKRTSLARPPRTSGRSAYRGRREAPSRTPRGLRTRVELGVIRQNDQAASRRMSAGSCPVVSASAVASSGVPSTARYAAPFDEKPAPTFARAGSLVSVTSDLLRALLVESLKHQRFRLVSSAQHGRPWTCSRSASPR